MERNIENKNTNLKQQYNTLKQKIENLVKNNNQMLQMYKSEEQRLIKSNEFLMQNKSMENTRNINELENEVIKMRNNIKRLQNILEPRNGNNLIENDETSNKNSNSNLNQEEIKEEYLINYKNKLKTEFEKKLISKHQELINYCTEQNKKIKQNNLNSENIIDINEIKFFSINNNNNNNNSDTEEFSVDDESSSSEQKEWDVDKINLILSLLCLKEEYPKDFFIDYILDDAFSERGAKNKNEKEKETTVIKKGRKQSAMNCVPKDIKKFNTDNKISEKICQLFDIKNKEDVDMMKSYVNKIILIDNDLRNYFEQNLIKYRFAPFEKHEKDNYDKKIKKCFGKYIDEIRGLLNKDENIISLNELQEFLNNCLNEKEKNDDFMFYILSLMKLSKNERKNEKSHRLKMLNALEFYLMPFYKKIIGE